MSKTKNSKMQAVTIDDLQKRMAEIGELAESLGYKINPDVKKATGAPSLYKPEYCQMLVDHMSKGLSFDSFAGTIDVTFKTLYNWAEEFPSFLQAKEQGTAKSILFWETIGNTGTSGHLPGFNSAGFRINMANRFGWRERTDLTSGGKELPANPPAQVVIQLPKNGREAK